MWSLIIKNWKTTVVGVVGAVLAATQVLDITHFTSDTLANIIAILTSFGLLFAKDSDVTGV